MAPKAKPQNPRGRRAGLTRERVLDAAIDLIDRNGLESFSLRRLACAIGVEPMSLYNHVANKDDLLDGVVELVMAKLASNEPPTGTWQEQARRSATAFRHTLLGHPQVSVIVLTRPVLTDLPLGVLRDTVAPLIAAGLPPAEAVIVVRTFTAFLTGAILRELGSTSSFAAIDPETSRARVAEIEASGDRVLAEAAREIAKIDHDAVFERGVDLFISGLEVQIGHDRNRGR